LEDFGAPQKIEVPFSNSSFGKFSKTIIIKPINDSEMALAQENPFLLRGGEILYDREIAPRPAVPAFPAEPTLVQVRQEISKQKLKINRIIVEVYRYASQLRNDIVALNGIVDANSKTNLLRRVQSCRDGFDANISVGLKRVKTLEAQRTRLSKLKQFCQPQIHIDKTLDEDCPVCLETVIVAKLVETNCNHRICRNCLPRCNNCPLCRREYFKPVRTDLSRSINLDRALNNFKQHLVNLV